MARHRLLQAFENFDPAEIDRFFGGEAIGSDAIPPAERAPVKRVAIFTEAFLPKVDGVTKSAYMTLRYLQETGREVIVFATDIAPRAVGKSTVVPLPSVSVPSAPETRLAFPTSAIRRHIDAFQPELIHLFSPMLMCAAGISEAHRLKIPVIANYQTDIPGYIETHYGLPFAAPAMRRWFKYMHNRCHLTLVGSQKTMQDIQHMGIRRLRLWRRGIDLQRFGPHKRSELWRLRMQNGVKDPNVLRCLYVGRLAPEKRVDLLIEVAKLPNVALTIVGDGAQREELEHLFADTNTNFVGYAYGEMLAEIYASADVFVFGGPNETFGQVVQEAMASGLPCVIVNRGGIVDLVEDGVNGILCEPTPEAFAAAVSRLQQDRELMVRMGAASRRMAEQRPWAAIMAELEGYYKEAIQLNNRYQQLRAGRRAPLQFIPDHFFPEWWPWELN